MTGRELIIYILQNNLEDEEVFKNGNPFGFMNIWEAAKYFNVGIFTVKAWIDNKKISYINIGDEIYVQTNGKNPKGVKDDEK